MDLHGDRPKRGAIRKYRGNGSPETPSVPPLRVVRRAILRSNPTAPVVRSLLGAADSSRKEAAEFDIARRACPRPGRRRQTKISGPRAPDHHLERSRAGSACCSKRWRRRRAFTPSAARVTGLIESIDALRPGGRTVNSNRLTRRNLRLGLRRTAPAVRLPGFAIATDSRRRQACAPDCWRKHPKNALRVPFLFQVFPDAKFIFLAPRTARQPRPHDGGLAREGSVTYGKLAGSNGPWSMLLPPGFERLRDRPVEEIAAFQSQAANERSSTIQGVPRDRWTTMRHERILP